MKSSTTPSQKCFGALFAALLGLLPISAAHAQIYVVTTNAGPSGNQGEVREYNFDGTTVNASLISGLLLPAAVTVSGSDVFVSTTSPHGANQDTIGEYTTSGVPLNPSMIQGVSSADGIVLSGSNMFVSNDNLGGTTHGFIAQYTTSGSLVNPELVLSSPSNGLENPTAMAASGSDLFVTNEIPGDGTDDTVAEFTTSGASVNPTLISGLFDSQAIAISGSDIFVANGNKIGEYTTSGATVNASLITGLQYHPSSLAISGSDIFVADGDHIGEYTTSGATVNAYLVTGLFNTLGIAIAGQASAAPAVTPNPGTPTSVGTTNGSNSYSAVAPVTAQGGLGTTVSLVDGTNNTGTAQNVTLATTNLGSSFKSLASDVVSVTGNAGSIFTVQLTFDLNAANQLGGTSALTLLWLNQAGQWVNAVDGNTGGTPTNMGDGAYNSATDFHLGYYGYDDQNGQDYVWAVINHNSDLGVGNLSDLPQDIQDTPEPSTWALLLGGLGLLAFWRARTHRAAICQG